MKQLKIRVTGRVQGIGYRAFAVRSARDCDIKGSVRNMPDGSVFVVAVGEDDALDRFTGELRKGPTFSVVKDLEIEEAAQIGSYEDFHVEY